MIHGSRASGAARPLIWMSVAEWPVWTSDAAIQAPVKAVGPATPAMTLILNARVLDPPPGVTESGGLSLNRVRLVSTG